MGVDQATGLRNLVDELRDESATGHARRNRVHSRSSDLAPRSEGPKVDRLQEGSQSAGRLRTIAITSGKGGVGKTNLTVNLAIALTKLRQRVLILDGDLGLANVDVLLGLNPMHKLENVLDGTRTLSEIVVDGPEGIKVIPGGSGLYDLANLDDRCLENLLFSAAELEGMADILLVDTSSGITSNVVRLLMGVDDMLVVATPEPTSLADAYGLIKVMTMESSRRSFKLVVNMARTPTEALQAAQRIGSAARRFLGVNVDYFGYVPADQNVVKSVLRQVPFMIGYPNCSASTQVRSLGCELLTESLPMVEHNGLGDFFRTVVRQVG